MNGKQKQPQQQKLNKLKTNSYKCACVSMCSTCESVNEHSLITNEETKQTNNNLIVYFCANIDITVLFICYQKQKQNINIILQIH